MQQSQAASAGVAQEAVQTVSSYRWRIVALLFAATTINYLDRSLLGVLAPVLQYQVFHWSDPQYAAVSIAFKLAYAIGLLGAGALIDRWGTRLGYLISIVVWSGFGALHALIQPGYGFVGFLVARFGLGLGEAGNFPAAIKAVASWFPAKERALAIGIFNGGANVGAILAPVLVLLIVEPSGTGWQFAFLVTSAFSTIWCILWWRIYRDPEHHPRVDAGELRWIRSDDAMSGEPAVVPTWRTVMRQPVTWNIAVLRLADAAWWFYLFWGGKFLFDQFGLNIQALALPLIAIYLLADAGSVGGGWISSRLIQRGLHPIRARKLVMLGCALAIMPVAGVTQLDTRFEVDQAFFERVSRTESRLTSEQASALDGMRGKSYRSAREFADALERASVAAPLNAKLTADCISAARSNQWYWLAVSLIAIAAAAHQAWAANMFSLIGDLVPRASVASVTGFGGMVGALSAILADFLVGQALDQSGVGGYFIAFMGAATVYLIVLAIFHLSSPSPIRRQS